MTDLSILIPSRNEMFLARTIQDILEHAHSDFEIIAVLDGVWASPVVPQHERVNIIYHPKSTGQRASINEAATVARGKYVMKVDAHCAFADGFDTVLLEDTQPDWTIVPIMRNLHAFNWVCPEGHTRYQGPSGPCQKCGNPTTMDVIWYPKPSPQSTSYCFDPQPHFQYFRDFQKRPEGRGDLTETMSLQGSCWMLTRDKYFELNVCDESFGSWGSQGIEVAVKTWLSGGKVIVDHKTYYAHMFRTQGGDFGFPYPMSDNHVKSARNHARDLFFQNKWEKQIHPISWLVERFWPIERWWTDDDLAKLKANDHLFQMPKVVEEIKTVAPIKSQPKFDVIYYTDNRLNPSIMQLCQKQLSNSIANSGKIISVSLQPIDFGDERIVLPLERGYLTMFKQILAGLEASTADVIFFGEHDILYHQSHFDFVPPRNDTYFYNLNCWKVRATDGHALYYDTKQTSQLCANRELLLRHYQERVRRTEKMFAELDRTEYGRFIRRQGFEPGSHGRSERVDDCPSDIWRSSSPNIDIRHESNLTPSRWRQDQFRDRRNCRNWQEAEEVPGWGRMVFV